MKRRQLIKGLAVLSGGVLVTSSGLLSACHRAKKERAELSAADVPLLDEIAETIIPETRESLGAKAAKTGAYMLIMVNECYSNQNKAIFIDGLDELNLACHEKFNSNFIRLNPSQKKSFLVGLQSEAKDWRLKHKPEKIYAPHYFELLKELTISGYFSSEIGATKARRYDPVPGSYHGCIAYKIGDRAWATK